MNGSAAVKDSMRAAARAGVQAGTMLGMGPGVRSGVRRGLPKALALALLVGGTTAFVSQQQHSHLDAENLPQRVRLDADPISRAELADDLPPQDWAGAPPTALTVLTPEVALPVLPVAPLDEPARPEPPSRPSGAARHARPYHRTLLRHWSMPHPHHHAHRRNRDEVGATRHTTGGLDWTALARCEAGGNPHAVDPSGRYGGLYQFDQGTWHSLGGSGRPQDASAGEQTSRARELYHRRGTAPWPTCGRRAGG